MCFYPFIPSVIFNCMILTCDKRVYKTPHHLEVSGVAGSSKLCPGKRYFLSFLLRSWGAEGLLIPFRPWTCLWDPAPPCARVEGASYLLRTVGGWGGGGGKWPASPHPQFPQPPALRPLGLGWCTIKECGWQPAGVHQDESRDQHLPELAWFMVGSFQAYKDTTLWIKYRKLVPRVNAKAQQGSPQVPSQADSWDSNSFFPPSHSQPNNGTQRMKAFPSFLLGLQACWSAMASGIVILLQWVKEITGQGCKQAVQWKPIQIKECLQSSVFSWAAEKEEPAAALNRALVCTFLSAVEPTINLIHS